MTEVTLNPGSQVLQLASMTDRTKAFVEAYLRDPNKSATKAYIAAGFQAKGHAAEVNASKLLKDPRVIAAIKAFEEARLERIHERLGISVESTLQGIKRLADSDVRRLFNDDGSPKAISELDDDIAHAIEGVDVLEQFEGSGKDRVFVGYVKKYRLAKKAPAKEMLAKHLDLYKKENDSKAAANVNALAALLGEMRRSALPVAREVEPDGAV